MFGIPERFKTNLNIKLKDFVPVELKQNDKHHIREAIRSVRMTYQITGEEIPSLVTDEHRCHVIQAYDVEVTDVKQANYIASVYQSLIKPLCIMRFYDSRNEVYSFADKRLSQTDENQVVVEDTYMTQRYPYGLPGEGIDKYEEYISFDNIKNRTEKLSLYREWMYKIYMIEHDSATDDLGIILESNTWYSATRTRNIYLKYVELVKARESIGRATTNSEKVKINKDIKKAKEALETEINMKGD